MGAHRPACPLGVAGPDRIENGPMLIDTALDRTLYRRTKEHPFRQHCTDTTQEGQQQAVLCSASKSLVKRNICFNEREWPLSMLDHHCKRTIEGCQIAFVSPLGS